MTIGDRFFLYLSYCLMPSAFFFLYLAFQLHFPSAPGDSDSIGLGGLGDVSAYVYVGGEKKQEERMLEMGVGKGRVVSGRVSIWDIVVNLTW